MSNKPTTTPQSSPENYQEGFTAELEEQYRKAVAERGENSLSANMFRKALEREKITEPQAEQQVIINAPMGKRD